MGKQRHDWTWQLARIGGKGAEARRRGQGQDACPYQGGYRNANGPGGSVQAQRRSAWLEGWASADADLKETLVKENSLYAVRVVHTGSDPLGDNIPADHAFFTMLTAHERGKEYKDLQPGEGGCVRRAVTADGRYTEGGKTHPILYSVSRVS